MRAFFFLPILGLIFSFLRLSGASPESLAAVAELPAFMREASGMVKSVDGRFFWMHCDSGDGPNLYPITREGAAYPNRQSPSIRVTGARAVDWEDVATDGKGTLFIGDIGNNRSNRAEITIYKVKEPSPDAVKTEPVTAYAFFYPEQATDANARSNYDAEALVWLEGALYVLTKHRADNDSDVYRLPLLSPGKRVAAQWVGRFTGVGMVTACALSPDGRYFAVLDYTRVTVFMREGEGFSQMRQWPRRVLDFKARQCEGLCFEDNETLWISSEFCALYQVKLSAFSKPIYP